MNLSALTLPIPVTEGPGSLRLIGSRASGIGMKRPLIVSDPGIVSAGHLARAVDSLQAAGLTPATFTEVRENPDTSVVEACRDAARHHDCDGFIGLGGGSSLDAAKGANFLFTNGGRMQDYWGRNKAEQPLLPLIAIPTTAGTGSECQGFALITDPDTHRKMACGDTKAVPAHVLLDPELTLTQPPFVAACTAMDALSHAVETAVTNVATADSLAYSHAAFAQLVPGFSRMLDDPKDLAARRQLQWGAGLAGAAIEASMLGMAHALANPLTGHLDTVHGRAVGVALPGVVRFNAADPKVAAQYAELWQTLQPGNGLSPTEAAEQVALCVEDLLHRSNLYQGGRELGLREELLDQLANEAAEQWTGNFNPRTPTVQDFRDHYRALLESPPA